MPVIRKFTFDTSFDEEEIGRDAREAEEKAAAERERLRIEAIKTEAREEGFAAGKAAGIEDARAESEHIAAQALAGICGQLGHIGETQKDVMDKCKRDAINAAMIIARKVLPEMSRKNALAEIESLVVSCLDRLLAEPRIILRVNDRMLKTLRDRIDEIADQAGYNGKITLVTNNKLKDPDCRVEWADGIAVRDMSALWEEVDKVINGYLQENGVMGSEGDDRDEHGAQEEEQEAREEENPPSVVDPPPAPTTEPATETSESDQVLGD